KSVREQFVFVAGRIISAQNYAFVAHHEGLLERDRYQAHVLMYESGAWRESAVFKWRAVGLAVQVQRGVLTMVLGRDGQVGLVDQRGFREETLDPKKPVGPLRGIDVISSVPYSYGMKREVFRRRANGRWEWFNKGMVSPLPKGKVDVKALIKERIKD